MAATPDGHGYWLVASDGGIFTFGDARYSARPAASASTARSSGWPPPRPATATGWSRPTAASSPSATPHYCGSTGAMHLQPPDRRHGRPTPGHGYWLVASDGGIFTFGDARYLGSEGGKPLTSPSSG